MALRNLSSLEIELVSGGFADDEEDEGGYSGDSSSSSSSSSGSSSSSSSTSSSTTYSACFTGQVGPVTNQVCVNSDNTYSVQQCLQAGPSVSVGGMGVGGTAAVCQTTTYAAGTGPYPGLRLK